MSCQTVLNPEWQHRLESAPLKAAAAPRIFVQKLPERGNWWSGFASEEYCGVVCEAHKNPSIWGYLGMVSTCLYHPLMVNLGWLIFGFTTVSQGWLDQVHSPAEG